MMTGRLVNLSYIAFTLVCLHVDRIIAVKDDNLPGNGPTAKKIFKKLLANYDPLVSPTPGQTMNITLECPYGRPSYDADSQTLKAWVWMKMTWKDPRLAWNKTDKIKVSKVRTYTNLHRLWIPRLVSLSVRRKGYTRVILNNQGKLSRVLSLPLQLTCRPGEGSKYPNTIMVCTYYAYQHPSFRLICNGKEQGMECCFKNKKFKSRYMWRIKKITSNPWKSKRRNYVLLRNTIYLQRNTPDNHFFVSPILIVGLMTALQCLVSLSATRRYFLTCILILAALDCAIAISEIPIVRQGGGNNLANMSGLVVGFNIVFLVWSCVAANLDRSGGTSWSVTKMFVEKADRYRFFLLLPSHVEVADGKEGGETATWAYFSLIVDRLMFLVWIVIFASFAGVSV